MSSDDHHQQATWRLQLSSELGAPEPGDRSMGDTGPWTRWIPTMWHVLADPDGSPMFPGPPRSGELGDEIAWWSPVLHLLAYSLGWPHVHVGLQRWDEMGRPPLDHRLWFLDEVWGPRLDELISWAVHGWAVPKFNEHITEAVGLPLTGRTSPGLALPPIVESSAFVDGDSLHLCNDHGLVPVFEQADERNRIHILTEHHRTAALLLDSYGGWYRQLHLLGTGLPALPGDHSWKVDVFCKPIGWLGQFRRSRTTGRWFSGQHSVHTLGT